MPKKQREKLFQIIEQQGIISLMNDTKWRQTLNALEEIQTEYRECRGLSLNLKFRVKSLLESTACDWGNWISQPVESYVESGGFLGIFLEIEWLEIDLCVTQPTIYPVDITRNYSAKLEKLLRSLHVPFTTDGSTFRILGHMQPTTPPSR